MILPVIQNMIVIKEVHKFFDSKVAPLDKKTMSGKGNANHTAKHSSLERTENNKILAEELHKPVIKKI